MGSLRFGPRLAQITDPKNTFPPTGRWPMELLSNKAQEDTSSLTKVGCTDRAELPGCGRADEICAVCFPSSARKISFLIPKAVLALFSAAGRIKHPFNTLGYQPYLPLILLVSGQIFCSVQ